MLASSEAARLVYHVLLSLSTTFFKIFQRTEHLKFCALHSRFECLAIITRHSPDVNTFFQISLYLFRFRFIRSSFLLLYNVIYNRAAQSRNPASQPVGLVLRDLYFISGDFFDRRKSPLLGAAQNSPSKILLKAVRFRSLRRTAKGSAFGNRNFSGKIE